MFYGEVFKALNKARVKYVIAGEVAVVLHGYERLTKDLDVIVLLEERNLEAFFEALKKIKYVPKVPVTKEQFKDAKKREEWKKKKNIIVFSFCQSDPPFKLIDMFVDELIPFKEVYEKRVRVKINNVTVPLISIDHLQYLKKKAGRPQDLFDIVQLEEIKKLQKKRK